jgi:hypothetical protein
VKVTGLFSLEVTAKVTKEGTTADTKTKVQFVSLRLDEELKPVVLKKTAAIRRSKKDDQVFEDTVTVKHEVMMATHWKVEAEVKAMATAVWASVQADINSTV